MEDKCKANADKCMTNARQMQMAYARHMHCEGQMHHEAMTNAKQIRSANARQMRGKCKGNAKAGCMTKA